MGGYIVLIVELNGFIFLAFYIYILYGTSNVGDCLGLPEFSEDLVSFALKIGM